jgi:hypothetical protein
MWRPSHDSETRAAEKDECPQGVWAADETWKEKMIRCRANDPSSRRGRCLKIWWIEKKSDSVNFDFFTKFQMNSTDFYRNGMGFFNSANF